MTTVSVSPSPPAHGDGLVGEEGQARPRQPGDPKEHVAINVDLTLAAAAACDHAGVGGSASDHGHQL